MTKSREGAVFETYVKLGPGRSLVELVRTLKNQPQLAGHKRAPSARTVETWSSKYGWQNRLAELDRRALEQFEQEEVEARKNLRKQMYEYGRGLVESAYAPLLEKEVAISSATEAIKVMDAGFRFMAQGVAEPHNRGASPNDKSDESLDGLSDDQLQSLLRMSRNAP